MRHEELGSPIAKLVDQLFAVLGANPASLGPLAAIFLKCPKSTCTYLSPQRLAHYFAFRSAGVLSQRVEGSRKIIWNRYR
jgi:hypothetical protein